MKKALYAHRPIGYGMMITPKFVKYTVLTESSKVRSDIQINYEYLL